MVALAHRSLTLTIPAMLLKAAASITRRLICGDYQNGSDCLYHGYFLMGGNFREFDVPDSVGTELHGVNNVGDFCGNFTDSTGLTQGFVSIGGTITPFSVPGSDLHDCFGAQ